MSPTIGLPPPCAERCLDTPRKSIYRGGTLIAEDVHDLGEHQRRLSDIDAYRPEACRTCGGLHLHAHSLPERHPRGEPSLPSVVEVRRFRCAECGATWRVLPLFLARHLWHAWKAIERAVVPDEKLASKAAPPIHARTEARWRARLASSGRVLVVLLAMSGGAALERVSGSVGLDATRGDVALAYVAEAKPAVGEGLASVGALLDRLERGIRLM